LDSFEFVQIPVAIVLGFGISEILAGWGHQLRHRSEQAFSGLQFVGSAYVLTWSFRYLWIQWATRPETWDYGAYLLAAAPAILLALAAHVVRFDPSFREHDPKSQYERSRRPVCVLLALFPVLMVARVVYSRGFHFQHPLVPAILVLTALVFAWLATTSRPRNQWIGWSVAWAMQLVICASFNPTLSLAP
jgi:hypothetical protein